MQRSGSEWLFRLAQEPRRLFRRYLKDLWGFNASLWPQLWQMKLRAPHPTDSKRTVCTLSVRDGWRQIRLPECFDAATAERQPLLMDEIVLDGRHCFLESSQVNFIDSTGVGVLIRLQKKLQYSGRQLVLISPSPQLRRALSLMHLLDFFPTASNVEQAKQLVEKRPGDQSVTQSPSVLPTLTWHGEVTAVNAEEIYRVTEAHLETLKAAPQASIDLSAVPFIDSSGLGTMVRIKKFAARHGIELAFTGPKPAVLNVIKLARLEKLLLAAAS
jgi:N-acetylglucosaminyldiphosphoundecaprenol N-acetyl-beta-D-mannosaminyltransferase